MVIKARGYHLKYHMLSITQAEVMQLDDKA